MKFVDLKTQFNSYEHEIRNAIDDVLASTNFINGSQIGELEERLASFCGAKHCIAVSSGTDALLLGLMAMDVHSGDEVIVPAFSFIATASMLALYKVRPVFVDINPVTYCIDPDKIENAITARTKGIIPVSLYGQIPDMERINAIAQKYKLWVLEDAAQSFGARINEKMSCNLSEMASTSFFPAKPLGCYGDGGALFTNSDNISTKLKQLRNHGQTERYQHDIIGINGRIDTIQAAILHVKLNHFPEEIIKRNHVAKRYTQMIQEHPKLKKIIQTPEVIKNNTSTWAQYTIRIAKHLNRNEIRQKLQTKGIPTAVHYPLPMHRQKAFAYLGEVADFPVADEASQSVLSLPMHAFITKENQETVVKTLTEVLP